MGLEGKELWVFSPHCLAQWNLRHKCSKYCKWPRVWVTDACHSYQLGDGWQGKESSGPSRAHLWLRVPLIKAPPYFCKCCVVIEAELDKALRLCRRTLELPTPSLLLHPTLCQCFPATCTWMIHCSFPINFLIKLGNFLPPELIEVSISHKWHCIICFRYEISIYFCIFSHSEIVPGVLGLN